MPVRSNIIALPLLIAGFATFADAASLGDPAKNLDIQTWVKGKAVDLQRTSGKNIVVVEFWATWCGPCRTSIPHLTRMQQKYEDNGVIVVGISDEELAQVKPFVDQMGSKMQYTVASDPDKSAHKDYMRAFGVDGIPHAFVVDKDGAIAWRGHPMAGLDEVLDQMIAGEYDLEAIKRIDEAYSLVPSFQEMVKSPLNAGRADRLAAEIIEKGAASADFLNSFAWHILTDPEVKHRNLELAMDAAERAYDLSQGKDPNIVDTYARAWYEKGDLDKAIMYQRKAVGLAGNTKLGEHLREVLEYYLSQ